MHRILVIQRVDIPLLEDVESLTGDPDSEDEPIGRVDIVVNHQADTRFVQGFLMFLERLPPGVRIELVTPESRAWFGFSLEDPSHLDIVADHFIRVLAGGKYKMVDLDTNPDEDSTENISRFLDEGSWV